MLYHNVGMAAHLLRFVDSAAIAATSLGTWAAGTSLGAWSAATDDAATVFVATGAATFLALGERLHAYHARRTEELGLELLTLCEVALYALGLSCMATQVFTDGLPGTAYAAATAASLLVLLVLRVAMRLTIRRARRRGHDYRVWLVVGHNQHSADVAEEILRNPHFGIRVEEIVDFAARPDAVVPGTEPLRQRALPGVAVKLLKSVESLRHLLTQHVIDEVVVTLPIRSHYDTIGRILAICCDAGISVRLRPQAFDTLGYATQVSYVGRIPMLAHYNGPSNYLHLLVKRLIDVIGATLGLLLLAPLLAGVAVAIKLGSPGPVFFRHTRVGLHGRHFELVKFRSMVKEAPQMREQLTFRNERDGRAFKIHHDARITPVGRWLRKYRIDELPQLWNVLVGDMSLVGPRPFPVNEAKGFEWWHRRRHTMQPGLTCFWQVEDDPKMPLQRWMELDMAYIDGWSIWLDLKLIARTFGIIIRGNGW